MPKRTAVKDAIKSSFKSRVEDDAWSVPQKNPCERFQLLTAHEDRWSTRDDINNVPKNICPGIACSCTFPPSEVLTARFRQVSSPFYIKHCSQPRRDRESKEQCFADQQYAIYNQSEDLTMVSLRRYRQNLNHTDYLLLKAGDVGQ